MGRGRGTRRGGEQGVRDRMGWCVSTGGVRAGAYLWALEVAFFLLGVVGEEVVEVGCFRLVLPVAEAPSAPPDLVLRGDRVSVGAGDLFRRRGPCGDLRVTVGWPRASSANSAKLERRVPRVAAPSAATGGTARLARLSRVCARAIMRARKAGGSH